MPRHIPIDARLIDLFWKGVERAGVSGREVAAHAGIDGAAVSRMRSRRTATPLDVALHTLDLTGPQPLAAALARAGFKLVPIDAEPAEDPVDTTMRLVEGGMGLLRDVREAMSDGRLDADEHHRIKAVLQRLSDELGALGAAADHLHIRRAR